MKWWVFSLLPPKRSKYLLSPLNFQILIERLGSREQVFASSLAWIETILNSRNTRRYYNQWKIMIFWLSLGKNETKSQDNGKDTNLSRGGIISLTDNCVSLTVPLLLPDCRIVVDTSLVLKPIYLKKKSRLVSYESCLASSYLKTEVILVNAVFKLRYSYVGYTCSYRVLILMLGIFVLSFLVYYGLLIIRSCWLTRHILWNSSDCFYPSY